MVSIILAIIGAVVPYAFFIQFFASQGVDVSQFVAALFANPVASGFTVDLLISSFVFWVVIIREYRHGKGANPILFITLKSDYWPVMRFACLLICSSRKTVIVPVKQPPDG